MYFDSLSAALTMDGHGAFVWSAYAITFAVLIALIVFPLLRQRRFFREQGDRLRREQGQLNRQQDMQGVRD